MPEGFFGIPFGGREPTPEEIEAAKEEHAQHQLHVQDTVHAIKGLLDDLKEDQLEALDLLLLNCPNPQALSFWRGKVAAIQQYKFDKCPCGTDHNAELASMAPEKSDMPATPEELMKARQDFDSEGALMEEYGIEPDPNYGMPISEDMAPSSPFRCKNCGIGVASLQDRMLREPGKGGCSGCKQKEMWG